MERIESPNNSKLKMCASLHLKKNREKLGLFAVEGVRLCETAAASAWEKVMAVVTDELSEKPRVRAILDKLEAEGCPIYQVSGQLYRKAAATVEPQGLLAVLRHRRAGLSDIPDRAGCIAVLDSVQDSGNVGSIIRTADAVGCNGVILLNGTADAFSDKTLRSAMGSVFHLPVVEGVSAPELLNFCQERGIGLFSTALDAEAESIFSADYGTKKAFIFGNEGNGVSAELLQNSHRLYIPMKGGTESLNVAAAAAVTLYSAFCRS